MSLDIRTLAELLHARAEASPNDIAIRTKDGSTWATRSWSELRDRADAIAAGILSAVELEDNDVIGLLGQTSEDWLACDFGGLSIGLQTVPIYASLLPEEVGYALIDPAPIPVVKRGTRDEAGEDESVPSDKRDLFLSTTARLTT